MFSNKMENTVLKVRALISHLLFGTTPSKTIVTDYDKPISIPTSMDSLEVRFQYFLYFLLSIPLAAGSTNY